VAAVESQRPFPSPKTSLLHGIVVCLSAREEIVIELGICTAACALSLIAEHIGLWHSPWRLSRPACYVVGTATIGLWWSIWCLWIGFAVFAVAFWSMLIGAGVWIVLAYWLRATLAKKDDAAYTAGLLSRQPLTQEYMDQVK
jgi:hypothetical protein